MKKNGPWKILSSKRIYKNLWLEIQVDDIHRPDGKEGTYTVLKIKPGVSVIPIDDDGSLYLIKEFKYPLKSTSIETATGGIEKGESILQAAKRELREELGIVADKWIELGATYPLTSFMKAPNYLFLVRNLQFCEKSPEGDEVLETFKVSLNEAVNMVMDGRIDNQKTCMCILKVNEYLRTKGV